MKSTEKSFVVCVSNKGTLPPSKFESSTVHFRCQRCKKLGQIRVIDESGEDYLYPEEFFAPVMLPQSAERALLRLR